jgi:TPP-dependent pyruvate/acetoin dehydrogenase alpha subunit
MSRRGIGRFRQRKAFVHPFVPRFRRFVPRSRLGFRARGTTVPRRMDPVLPATPPAILAANLAADGGASPPRAAHDVAEALLRHMIRARILSARMVALQRHERIGFHTASIGEEAAIVGAALATRAGDWVFPGAREWYAALARGMPLERYVHHAFGSGADPAKGHAAPDHVPGRAWNVAPPSGIPGAHLPQAVGAGWASRIGKTRSTTGGRDDTGPSEVPIAAVALFGSEVLRSGDFHNALNFAGVMKAPVVLVCRSRAGEPDARIGGRALAYGVASARVDGSDAIGVVAVVRAALARAYDGKGATLVEVVSPVLPTAALADRAFAESTVLDLGEADPIVVLGRVLAREGRVAPAALAASSAEEARREVDLAVAAAERAGLPRPETLFDDVYADVPPHLAAQRLALVSGAKPGD